MTNQEIIIYLKSATKYQLITKEIKKYKIYIISIKPWCKNISEVSYCLKNNILNVPLCPECGEKLKYKDGKSGYSLFCSMKCAHLSKNTKEKFNKTMNEKTQQEINGISRKRRQTNLKKYGNICSLHGEHQNEMTKKTWMINHGGHPFNNTEIKNKSKQTKFNRYGDENYNNTKKFKETCFKKYGTENPMQNMAILEKTRKSFKLKMIQKRKEFINENYNELSILTKEALNKYNSYRCHNCDKNFEFSFNNQTKLLCPYCSSNKVKSKPEIEILDFIQSFNVNIKRNLRTIIKPLELDFYLPEQNIAIEYNGIYWHSELKGKDKNYHLNKTKLCEEKGIQLLHIFENEWINKQEIVKSIIKSKLQLNERIFARKCVIKEVVTKDKNIFLNDNHIQGADKSNVNLGLYYENKLYALMTFCKSRYNKNYQWEISRFCNILNTNIIGGASKLLKAFERNYDSKSIITYADKRYSNGNLYKQLGFEYLHDSNPNYFYFKNMNLMSRLQFQKHKLKDKLNIFNEELTEWQNMVNNGYNRIWDCGNSVFIK